MNYSIPSGHQVLNYEGYHGTPSRCRMVWVTTPDGNVHVAFNSFLYGGTSPTNFFENLASQVKRLQFGSVPVEKLNWYDSSPAENSTTGEDHIASVEMIYDASNSRYLRPSLCGRLVPTELFDAIAELLAVDRTSAYQQEAETDRPAREFM